MNRDAVDAGSTAAVAKTMAGHQLSSKGIHAGGFDRLPTTLEAIAKGDLDFTTCTWSLTSKGDRKPSSSRMQCRANSTPFWSANSMQRADENIS